MFIRALNIKAIEKQKLSYLLVVDNKYSKTGEELYWINQDALKIIKKLNGSCSFDDIAKDMCNENTELLGQAKENLSSFLKSLQQNYGVRLELADNPTLYEIPVLGTGTTQYPSAVSIEITHKCNAKCLHCYGDYSCQNDFEDNTENIKKLLKDSRKSGTRVVEFTGGEATCHPQFIEILQEAYKLNYNLVSILSNGLSWSEELFSLIEDNKDKTVVQVDLHGDNDSYINWFMGTKIEKITNRIKSTISRIHNMGIFTRVVTMITPRNLEQIMHIADWVNSIGIKSYGISSITPMGRATIEDENNILLGSEDDISKSYEVIQDIVKKYGSNFLYFVKDGDPTCKNCGAFTSNPSITPEGNIKFCAMDDESLLRPFGNVFLDNIGKIYTNKSEEINMIRNIPAPSYDSDDCKDCSNKYFCSYCIIRGLKSAKERDFKDCNWYANSVPKSFKELLL